ncbi:glycoside hydrolase family 43 protein [Aspergillus affinis]|uniref:glycoside hydrolase family 43 protein n=1 Tax=Aspergillus affinis TaxID=1070780 RepID=UPI0022FF3432|nr:putative endo-arabinase [Aspergillus affinis]KAI9036730.1 putative endo-arabinase [Aspergillus affinis]
MWCSQLSSWTLGLALVTGALASPFQKRAAGARLAIDSDFPDPSFVGAPDGTWYAFGTNGNGKRIQVATSPDFQTWTLTDKEALPTLAGWETEIDHWAPDVVQRKDGKYVMYYSGEAKEMVRHHCVGVAVSEGTDPAGPYIPNPEPLSCRLDQGGSIDPAGFLDKDGSRYVVFKVDGNSIGNGGDCNNGIEPLKSTPILMQKVKEDGFTLDGEAVQILDRDDSAGPLVEAPNLILHDDTYFLFYSTHCYTDPKYDVRYATSKSITGPYVKNDHKLFKTGDYGLTSPGGGTVCGCGDRILFHGFCGEDKRCTYAADISIDGDQVTAL